MVSSSGPDWEQLRPELTQRGFTDITEIGRGGMGYVLRAWDPDLERWVAIKVITRFAASNPENVRRFRSEMRLLGRIHHPAVITVYDGTMREDLAYFLMSYIPGGTLEQLITQRRGLGRGFTVRETVSYLRPIAEALDAVHSMQPPVIHRDVKPANILVPAKGSGREHAVLTDFGISLVGGDTRFTSTGIVIGSEQYMAPERFATEHGDDDGGPAADNYALALIAWEMLTLVPMFSTMSRQNWRFGRRVPSLTGEQLTGADRGRDAELNRVFQRLLANDPHQRPARAVEMLELLDQAAGASAARVPTPNPVSAGTAETRREQWDPRARHPADPTSVRPQRTSRRAKVATTAVAAAVAAVAVGTVLVVNNLSSTGAQEDIRRPQWAGAQAALRQTFPDIVPEVPGDEGGAELECLPGTPAEGQSAQIVCGDEALKVTLARYTDAAARDGALGDGTTGAVSDVPACIDSVKEGTHGERVMLADDGVSSVVVTGTESTSGYRWLDYCG